MERSRSSSTTAAFGVTDLDVTGKGLRALADLSLGKERNEGILYVRFHGLSLGIELKDGGKDLKLIRPLYWFETERARRGGAARPAVAEENR